MSFGRPLRGVSSWVVPSQRGGPKGRANRITRNAGAVYATADDEEVNGGLLRVKVPTAYRNGSERWRPYAASVPSFHNRKHR